MAKRSALLIVFVLIVSSIVCSCADNDLKKYGLDPKTPIKITVWHYYNGAQKDAFDRIAEKFNSTIGAEKGIIVQGEAKGRTNDLIAAVIGAANGEVGAGDLPDIFAAYSDTAYEVFLTGQLCDIGEYMTQEEIDDFIPDFIQEAAAFPGQQMCLFPIAKATELLYINKTDYNKFVLAANASGKYEQITKDMLSTWEGLYKLSQIYTQYNKDNGIATSDSAYLFGIDSMANLQIVANKQLGNDIIDASGEPDNSESFINIEQDVQKRIWDYIITPYITGVYGKQGSFVSDDMKTGKGLMGVSSSASSAYVPLAVTRDDGSSYPIEIEVLPYPVFEGGKNVAIQQGAGMAVTKSDPKTEYACVTFLKYFVDKQQITDFAVLASYLPPTRDALDRDVLEQAVNQHYANNISLDVVNMSLDAAITQFDQYNLYFVPPASGSFQKRSVLENVTLETIENLKLYGGQNPTDDDFNSYLNELSRR